MKRKKATKLKIWTPHRYLVAAIRKTWRWSPARAIVLKRVQVEDGWKCEQCSKVVTKDDYITKRGRKRKRINGAVDHIEPVGKQPKDFSEYPAYLKRMFCEVSNLQFLCTECHAPKSKAERGKK